MKENLIEERNATFQPFLFVAVPQTNLRYAMGIKMKRNYTTINVTIYDSLKTLIILTLATAISFLFVKITNSNMNVAIYYILAVVLISRFTTGYFFGIIACIAGVIGLNYYFTYPYFALDFTINGYPITFLGMLCISIIISTLTTHIKEQAKQAFEREEKANRLNAMLNEINNKLLSSNGLSYIIELTLEYIVGFINSTVVFYSQSPQSGIKGIIKSCNPTHEKILNSRHEQFIAHWVFENKRQAGVGTDFCGESSCIYLPLISHDNVWGVLGIYCISQKPMEENIINFLNLMISQAAMAIERQHLTDNQQLIIIETEKEKMRANLLRAVSHDLRTPLTGMIGASETLMKNKTYLNETEKDKLISYIYEDSNWLLHMVENLLSVTRIREGNSSVDKIPEPIEEVVSEAIMRVKKRYPDTQIIVKVPDDFLMIPMDATLIEQVIMNLIENALKHSGSSKPIELFVTKEVDQVLFHIVDQGIGIREDRLDSIFDGYTHAKNQSSDSTKGIGIGLSICKTIINAHGGTISVKNQTGGGASFTFTLPLKGD